MNSQPKERRIALTGGARGIGFATARTLLDAGHRVAIGDIDAAALERAHADLDNPRLSVLHLDVTDKQSFTTFLDAAEAQFGPLDVLVNNAGIMPVGPLLDESDEIARRMVEINVHGVITGTKLALERMAPRRSGHVINVASVAGRVSSPGQATYCATKHAVVGFTDAVRLEFADRGIDVSMVLPSFTETEMLAGTRAPRLTGNLPPAKVAKVIVDVIDRPRAEAIVPGYTAPLIHGHGLLPRPVQKALAHFFGNDTIFLEVDAAARKAYDNRIG
ncbi:SDR family oxidoreductase [Antrihabitans stalactiti]|uniref:SDR family oxidoreductase n=1 Tax=Antrihabitans stalactiti TaxID=2584121 RepID=A0A848KE62_9NOCA|nr:SDR family oxidoreductase [Antrihabitans stalactiti]NMN95908.1 SDR family oxidoreductase [Antrihabitans stalactiti]